MQISPRDRLHIRAVELAGKPQLTARVDLTAGKQRPIVAAGVKPLTAEWLMFEYNADEHKVFISPTISYTIYIFYYMR
jgi:hypothetical protein